VKWLLVGLLGLSAMQITPLLAAEKDLSDLGDLMDPADPAATIDLAETPLGISLLQLAALKLRDQVLKAKFQAQLNDLSGIIERGVAGKGVGFLLKVEMYSDEFGIPSVPEGQLVFPVGEGITPVDALAEFIRTPHILPTHKNLRNDSYYLWITKVGNKLNAGVVRPALRATLEKRALNEADRLNLLVDWRSAMPATGIESVNRATYWQEVANKYADHLASEEHKKKVRALVQEFDEAQQKFNVAYHAYQEVDAELRSQNILSNALGVASTLIGVVDAACKIQMLQSDSGKSVTSQGVPEVTIIEATQETQRTINGITVQRRTELRIIKLGEGDLTKRDAEIRQIFKDDSVPIPSAETPLIPPP
jgi:hypothetical protein